MVDREVEVCKLFLHGFDCLLEFLRACGAKECIITLDNCEHFRSDNFGKYTPHDLVLYDDLEEAGKFQSLRRPRATLNVCYFSETQVNVEHQVFQHLFLVVEKCIVPNLF